MTQDTGRALESVLDALHGFAAEALMTELRQHMEQLALNPERAEAAEAALAAWEATEDRDPKKRPPPFVPYQIPPQFLDKVLKFLASNGVTAPRASPRVDALAAELADLDLDEAARPRPN